jgi:hypothetical protein
MKYLLAAGLANCQENAKLSYYTRLGHKLRFLYPNGHNVEWQSANSTLWALHDRGHYIFFFPNPWINCRFPAWVTEIGFG